MIRRLIAGAATGSCHPDCRSSEAGSFYPFSAHNAAALTAEVPAARRAAPQSRGLARARVLRVPGAYEDAKAADRNFLVLANPNVIINDLDSTGWGQPL
jgi:hypothetical protein